MATKRGRGQRRCRRLKNRSLTEARRMALQHLRWNPVSDQERAGCIADLTRYFRQAILNWGGVRVTA